MALPHPVANMRSRRRLPLLLGCAALALLLLINVPLFLCMPVATEVSVYDYCAHLVLRGGVLYRDVFEVNFPGVVWLHVAFRSVVGWRPEAIRLADLLCVGIIALLLVDSLRQARRPATVGVWTVFLVFAFYFSTTEWCHCQRDGWMLLPALAAVALRQRQLTRLVEPAASAWRQLLGSVVEGVCWGLAFWIKPFVIVPAIVCWLWTAAWVGRRADRPFRLLAGDAAGLLIGGLLVGAMGVAWLVQSGTWPCFIDQVLVKNREYHHDYGWAAVGGRLLGLFLRMWPWGLLHLAAVPLAGYRVARSLNRPLGSPSPTEWDHQALFAVFYLGWLGQAVGLQRGFEYHFVPAVWLALTVLASTEVRPGYGRRLAATVAVAAFLLLAAAQFPLVRQPGRLRYWSQCLSGPSTPQLRDRLTLLSVVDWESLDRVEHFLAEQGVRDGQVNCEEAGPVPLYLTLDCEPATRFLFLDYYLLDFAGQREEVRRELTLGMPRYLVVDLYLSGLRAGVPPSEAEVWRRQDEQCLPANFPSHLRPFYPWTEPIAFRAGRYLVLDVKGRPVGKFWVEEAPGAARSDIP